MLEQFVNYSFVNETTQVLHVDCSKRSHQPIKQQENHEGDGIVPYFHLGINEILLGNDSFCVEREMCPQHPVLLVMQY